MPILNKFLNAVSYTFRVVLFAKVVEMAEKDKRVKDVRFLEFCNVIKDIHPYTRLCYLEALSDSWKQEISAKFSIGSIRYLFREAKKPIPAFVARCLYECADDADKAIRALSCWPHYTIAEQEKLALVMMESSDHAAPNHVAYMLTRTRQIRRLSREAYASRATLITNLKQRGDSENVSNALRWDEQFGSPLLQSERVLLKEIAKQNKKKGGSS